MPDNPLPEDFRGAARRIESDQPYRDAAAELGCDPAALRAVAEVESRGAPFMKDGRPPILFERHVFSRRTDGAHDAAAPDISSPDPGGYEGGAAEYDRLARAMALDPKAALESASWGQFQIMGFNHETCGFDDVEDFVAAMCDSQEAQLAAFVAFVKANGLDAPLRRHDWAAFARGYNGPAFAENRYDRKMASAHARHSGAAPEGFRVETIRDLQLALNFLGANAGDPDGLIGPDTRAAIRRFQAAARLPLTGEPTPALMQAVQAVAYALDADKARALV